MTLELDNLTQLARDTLCGNTIRTEGCFVTNGAGIRLADQDGTSLESIELVIKEYIESRSSPSDSPNPKHSGIDYLIGAYLVIGSKFDSTRSSAFIKSLPVDLQILALNSILGFFIKTDTGFNFGVAPSHELRDFIQESLDSTDANVRHAATRAAAFIAQNTPV